MFHRNVDVWMNERLTLQVHIYQHIEYINLL